MFTARGLGLRTEREVKAMTDARLEHEVLTAQEYLEAFELWQGLQLKQEMPDSRRFEKEFFEVYGDQVTSTKAPWYLMFCAFVGGVELALELLKGLDQEDTETAK